MYVARPYFVFMEAMVSCLIYGEIISHVWNPCCIFHFTMLCARVRMGHVGACIMRKTMLPLYSI